MPTMVKVNCVICDKEYEIELKRYNAKLKENSAFYCSAECRSHKGSTLCHCANCGKEVWRTNSQLKRSKTGNIYCSKSCSNTVNNSLFKSGENHYAYKGGQYRQNAFDTFEHKCIQIFRQAAESHRKGRGLCGVNDERTEGGQGLLS